MPVWKNPIAICAMVLLIAFFLPWAGIFGKTIAGYNIGIIGPRLAQASAELIGEYDPRWMLSLLLYLIPILSVITLILSSLKINKWERIFGFLTGILPVIGIVYLTSEIGDDLFNFAEFGLYITLLAAIGILIASFIPFPQPKKEELS